MSAIPHVIAKCEGPEREVFLQKDGEDCFSGQSRCTELLESSNFGSISGTSDWLLRVPLLLAIHQLTSRFLA